MKRLLTENIRRILLIRFGSLGDVVLTLPVIGAVRKSFPDAYIAMIVGDRSADIVSADTRLDEVIVFQRQRQGLSEMKRVADLIMERNFDVSIDMQRKFRTSLLAYWGGAKCRIGYHQPAGFLCSIRIPDRENKHAVDRNLDLLIPLEINNAKREPEMHLSQEDRDYANEIFKSRGLIAKSPVLGIFPGAGWRPRCWPAECFAAICDLAVENYGAKIVIFGGPDEAEIVDNAAQKMKNPAVLMKDKITLRQLGAMIEKCSLLLSNDTGPMHISVAVKTTTIGLFGPGNYIRFQPIGEKHAIIRKDIPCSPCKQFTRKCKDNICMKSITVDEVWKIVKQRLEVA